MLINFLRSRAAGDILGQLLTEPSWKSWKPVWIDKYHTNKELVRGIRLRSD